MKEIRCGHCRKKLAEGTFTRLAIKCPRCGTLNDLSARNINPERRGAPHRFDGSRHARYEYTQAAR